MATDEGMVDLPSPLEPPGTTSDTPPQPLPIGHSQDVSSAAEIAAAVVREAAGQPARAAANGLCDTVGQLPHMEMSNGLKNGAAADQVSALEQPPSQPAMPQAALLPPDMPNVHLYSSAGRCQRSQAFRGPGRGPKRGTASRRNSGGCNRSKAAKAANAVACIPEGVPVPDNAHDLASQPLLPPQPQRQLQPQPPPQSQQVLLVRRGAPSPQPSGPLPLLTPPMSPPLQPQRAAAAAARKRKSAPAAPANSAVGGELSSGGASAHTARSLRDRSTLAAPLRITEDHEQEDSAAGAGAEDALGDDFAPVDSVAVRKRRANLEGRPSSRGSAAVRRMLPDAVFATPLPPQDIFSAGARSGPPDALLAAITDGQSFCGAPEPLPAITAATQPVSTPAAGEPALQPLPAAQQEPAGPELSGAAQLAAQPPAVAEPPGVQPAPAAQSSDAVAPVKADPPAQLAAGNGDIAASAAVAAEAAKQGVIWGRVRGYPFWPVRALLLYVKTTRERVSSFVR